jgi:phenylacetate-CoA ligase
MEAGARVHDPRYESADADAIRALQVARLREVLRAAYATNGFYRERWDAAGVDIERVDSLEALAALVPMVAKSDFVADQLAHPPFGKRLEHAVGLHQRLEIYTTSGTSGQGVEVHAQTERELAEMVEMYRYMFRWAGLAAGDIALLTLPLTMLGGGRIEWQGAIGSGLTVLPAGNIDAHAKLALLERFQPKALYGSTSYFGHLLAIADRTPPCPSIEVLLTGLEGVGFSYLEQLQQGWQAAIADRFGCTQLRADFMFTCEHGIGTADRPGLLHNLDPFIITEVIDVETGRQVADGEFGEMVVTSLYHLDNPVIRCRLRDGGVWHPGAYCGCGRPFGGVEVASVTRTDDVKKIKGINVFPQAVDDLVFSFAEVDEYRVVLTSSASMADIATVRVMLKTPAADGLPERIGGALRDRIGIHFAVEVVDAIERSEYKVRRWHDERIR